MSKDVRYNVVKQIIQSGLIEELSDIFKYIPKTIVANDLEKDTGRTYVFFEKMEQLTLRDIYRLAQLIEVDAPVIFNLIDRQYVNTLEEEKKSKTKLIP